MKRFVCWGIVICMMLTGWGYAEQEEPEAVPFESILLNIADQTSSAIMASASSRALFSALVVSDLKIFNEFEYEFDLAEASYVGKAGTTIYFWVRLSEKETEVQDTQATDKTLQDLIVVYLPMKDEAGYMMVDHMSDVLAEIVMEETCTDGWYENDPEELYEMGMELVELLQESVGK